LDFRTPSKILDESKTLLRIPDFFLSPEHFEERMLHVCSYSPSYTGKPEIAALEGVPRSTDPRAADYRQFDRLRDAIVLQ
jgi:hypothetical protein